MQRIILHLDMNSYFASVEQQANPFLRGQPVGICAYLSKNGCLIATSKEAKKFGVITGMRVPEALKLCPRLFLAENDPNKYKTVSTKLFRLMAQYGKTLQAYSIDEAFLDLTGIAFSFQLAENIAREISHRVKSELGEWLACSIGVSFTKFLAKFAGDTAPQGQINVISDFTGLNEAYQGRKVDEAWGIGPAITAKLKIMGINTLLEFKKASPGALLGVFGKYGYFLWAKINGFLDEELNEDEHSDPKSIGHSYCLNKPTQNKEVLKSLLGKLAFKVISRLRSKNLEAYGFYLHWSYKGRDRSAGFGVSLSIKKPIRLAKDIFILLDNCLKAEPLTGTVSMIAVGVFKLLPFSGQAGFFDSKDYLALIRSETAVSALNIKYGSFTVYPGILHEGKNNAPDRIGFRKVDFDF